METATQTTTQVTDRLLQTLTNLARLLDETMNEVHVLNSEYEDQVRQAAQDAGELEQVRASERLKLATDETEQITRELVTEELEIRFKQDMAVAVESVRTEFAAERLQMTEELERLRNTSSEWETERARLIEDYKRASELLEQTRQEHDRALAETDEAAAIALERQILTAVERVRAEAALRWETERTGIVAERDRALEEHKQAAESFEKKMNAAVQQYEAERESLVTENQSIKQQLSQATDDLEQARRTADEAQSGLDAVRAEVARVESVIADIAKVVEDPTSGLSIVIRANAERAELESYLRGIRFALGK